MVPIWVFRILHLVDFESRLLGQIAIKIDHSLDSGFQILQKRRQRHLERVVCMAIRFFRSQIRLNNGI